MEETTENPTPLLWHANAPWVGTGYGTQTALFGPLLQSKLGYEVAFSAFFGLRGSRLGWVAPDGTGFMVYPGGADTYGNDVLGAHARHWFRGRSGLVVTLTDPWVLMPEICARLPLLAWTPIDHDELIPKTDVWLKRSNALPIAMSKFGRRVMLEAGHETVYYAPHGFDPNVFRQVPVPPPEVEGFDPSIATPTVRAVGPEPARREARKMLGIPQDAFVVGMVAANQGVPSRKGFSQALSAFARFKQMYAPEAVLYLHTKMENPTGEDLVEMCDSLKIKALSPDQYTLALGTPSTYVAATMRAFDVLLNPAHGEGFGVPLIEAQACGTPCITTNFSSMIEVAPEPINWHVEGQPEWTGFNSWQVVPFIDSIVEALRSAYAESENDRLARRDSVALHAILNYQVENIVQDCWHPILKNAQEEIAWRAKRMAKHSRR